MSDYSDHAREFVKSQGYRNQRPEVALGARLGPRETATP